MSFRRTALGAALLILMHAPAAMAVEPNFYINRGAWLADMTGNGETGKSGPMREFDFDETLDLNLDEQVPSLDFFLRLGSSRFIVSWNRARYTGDNKLDDDLVFKGTTYTAGGKLRSTMNYDRWRFMYGRPITNGKKISLGFLIGLEDIEIDHEVEMKGPGRSSARINSRIPVIGASLIYHPIPFLRIYGEATGTNFDRDDVDSKLLNTYVRVEYDLYAGLVAASLGYRYAFAESEEEDKEAYKVTQKGLSAGLTVKF